jgi:methyl-accepting chemotaxis protein
MRFKMKKFSNLKVGTKLIIKSVSILTAVLIAAFVTIILYISDFTNTNENASLTTLAEKNAAVMKAELETPLNVARTMAQSMQGYDELYVNSRRAAYDTLLKNVLMENPEFLGVWTCWSPNALDGMDEQYKNTDSSDSTGRYIPYWQHVGSDIVLTPLVDYETPGAGDYYLLARDSAQETIIDPYEYEIDGEKVLLTTVAVPVKDKGGNVVAVTGVDLSLGGLQSMTLEKGGFETSTVCLLSNRGTYVINQDNTALGASITDRKESKADEISAAIASGQQYRMDGASGLTGKQTRTVYVPITIGDTATPWSTGVSVDIDEIMVTTMQITLLLIAILAALIVIIVVSLILIIRRSITKPIKDTAEFAKALASGRLDQPIVIKSEDEIGQLAGTLDNEVRQAFKDIEQARVISEKQAKFQSGEVEKLLVNLERLAQGKLYCDIEVEAGDGDTAELYRLYKKISDDLHTAVGAIKNHIKETAHVLGEISRGNLTAEIASDYKGDFAELKDSINGIVRSLNGVMGEINASAEQVAAGTKQVSDGSQEISQGATEQASAIEQLTASIEEIAAQTKQNAEKTKKALDLAAAAQAESATGNEQMKALQQAMTEINASSTSISKIIKVIDDIAFQTNILALNAAVEAARAGVHGKGFAVVAEEVRNLAARSANAAKETTELIESSVKKVGEGSRLADVTAKALTNILKGSEESAKFMNEIADASNQQATGISQVNHGIEQMAQVVQTNSATSEEAAAAAEELSSQAELLKSMVGRFTLKEQDSQAPAARKADVKESEANSRPGAESPKIALSDDEFGKY